MRALSPTLVVGMIVTALLACKSSAMILQDGGAFGEVHRSWVLDDEAQGIDCRARHGHDGNAHDVHAHDGRVHNGNVHDGHGHRHGVQDCGLDVLYPASSPMSSADSAQSAERSDDVDSEDQRDIAHTRVLAADFGWLVTCTALVSAAPLADTMLKFTALVDDLPQPLLLACGSILLAARIAPSKQRRIGAGNALVWAAGLDVQREGSSAATSADTYSTVDSLLGALVTVLPVDAFQTRRVIDGMITNAARRVLSDNLRAVHRHYTDAPAFALGVKERARLDALALDVARKSESPEVLEYILNERVFVAVEDTLPTTQYSSLFGLFGRRRRKSVDLAATGEAPVRPATPYHVEVLLAAVQNGYHALRTLVRRDDKWTLRHRHLPKFTVDDLGAGLLLAARMGAPALVATLVASFPPTAEESTRLRFWRTSREDLDAAADMWNFIDTALSVSAMHGHASCVRFLLRVGADVNRAGGDQLLRSAEARGQRFVVAVLKPALAGEPVEAHRRVRFSVRNEFRIIDDEDEGENELGATMLDRVGDTNDDHNHMEQHVEQ